MYNVHKVIISIIGGCTNVQKVKIFTKWEELKVVQVVQMYKKKKIFIKWEELGLYNLY